MSILKGACTDWTSYIEINRPNCLILMRFVKTKEQTDLDRLILMLQQLTRGFGMQHSTAHPSEIWAHLRLDMAFQQGHNVARVICLARAIF